MAFMRIAFRTGLHACLTTDASIGVDKEKLVGGDRHRSPTLLLWFELLIVLRRSVCFAQTHGTDFVLGDLGNGVLGGDR